MNPKLPHSGKWETILESAPDLYLILNQNFEVIGVSNAFLKATFSNKVNLIGRKISEVFPDKSTDQNSIGVNNLTFKLQELLKTKSPGFIAVQKFEAQKSNLVAAEREDHYLSIVSTPVLDENNEVEFIILRLEDVTEFVQPINSKNQNADVSSVDNNHIEEKILARTKEIHETNKKLRIAVEMSSSLAKKAKDATRMKSEFLANMSHEIRTPLNAIIGFAELMSSGKVGHVSDTHFEFLQDILQSARHLLKLINDILDLAKIEAGKMEFNAERVNLPTLIDEVKNIVLALIIKKQMKLEVIADPTLQEVITDPARLKQALYNFISNAIKFTPPNGHIEVVSSRLDQDMFKIAVRDNGIGIHKKDLPKLFREFQQLENQPHPSEHQGTGLGLALTRKMIEAQGGSVGVESTWGQGSTFCLVLPLISRSKPKE